ncbi:MAG: alanine racemase [Gammaproteobacteria bacterium]|nr:alanine racemase [Gammaproteobacteria bacterium]
MTSGSWRARAVIDNAAFIHNLQRARQLAPNSQLMAVVKANAYGHGVEALSAALNGSDQLAVIDVAEAQVLREKGLAQPITILQGASSADELRWCVENDAIPVVCNLDQLRLLTTESTLSFWIKLDTGMHRLGLSAAELAEAMSLLNAAGIAGPYGFMTHFACADNDAAFTQQQQTQFAELTKPFSVAQASLANSAAIFDFSISHADVIRPGIMLYGATPFSDRSAESLGLQPVMSLQAKVAAVRDLKAGEGVGYGMAWKADKACQVAVISAGYGDGVPRNMPAGQPLAVGECLAQSVGRVSMDSCFALLPDGANVAVGDVATIWGKHENGELLPVDELAHACGTIGYELLTRVTPRVQRVSCNG